MRLKLISLSLLAALAAIASGCKSTNSQSAYAPNNTNFLGIVKHEPANYGSVGMTTFHVATDELVDRKDFSGNRTTLLWGLITVTDY